MPRYNRPFLRGRLFIHFKVEFPDSGFLSPEKCRLLEKALPQKSGKNLADMDLDDCEETTLHDVNLEEEMKRKRQHQYREAYDDDDDDNDESSGPRVQCAQQ